MPNPETSADVEIDIGDGLGPVISRFGAMARLREYARQSMRGISVAVRLRAKEKAKRALEREGVTDGR